MAVQFFIWNESKSGPKGFGHVSLRLSDRTYISWWPEDKKNIKSQYVNGCYSASFDSDIKTMDGKGPRTTILTGLDDSEMRRWWKDFVESSPEWDYMHMNCATVIFNILCAGNDYFKKFLSQSSWTPRDLDAKVMKYIEDQTASKEQPAQSRGKINNFNFNVNKSATAKFI